MSKTDPVTENPNDKAPPGNPLGPNEVAPTESNGLGDDEGRRSVESDEDDDPGSSDMKTGGHSVGP